MSDWEETLDTMKRVSQPALENLWVFLEELEEVSVDIDVRTSLIKTHL